MLLLFLTSCTSYERGLSSKLPAKAQLEYLTGCVNIILLPLCVWRSMSSICDTDIKWKSHLGLWKLCKSKQNKRMEEESRELNRLMVLWVAVQMAGWCHVTSDWWRWIQAHGNSCNYLQSVKIWRQRWKTGFSLYILTTNRNQHWFLCVYQIVFTHEVVR